MGELMTTETETAAFSKYDGELQELAARQATFAGDYLQLQYQIGVLAEQMANAASQGGISSTYGKKVVEHVAERLHRREREIYACIQLARRLSQEEIDEFKQAPRPWPLRAVSALLTVAGEEALQEFRQRYEGGDIETTDDLRKAIVAHNEGRRPSPRRSRATKSVRSGRQARAQVMRLSTFLNQLTKLAVPEAMKGFRDYTKNHSSYVPAIAAEVENAMKEAKRRINSLGKCLEKARAEIDAALAKEVKCDVA